MLNREFRQVTVKTYANTVDAYGQKRQGTSTTRYVPMVIKISSQSNVNDPRYVDVTDVGITPDTSITVDNQIIDGTVAYDILYIIPSSRYTTILMRKV